MIAACNVYISEGQNSDVITRLQTVASTAIPTTSLANLFIDRPYNRSNFTLISRQPDALSEAVVSLSLAALLEIDLQKHSATHPRLGVVDHISCHPLSHGDDPRDIDAAALTARTIAQHLGETHGLPSYLYGNAHPNKMRLADVRRQLGYFSASKQQGQIWAGALDSSSSNNNLPVAPDFGPVLADPRAGVACIGAVPWIINLNVLLESNDMHAVRAVAKAVSERGGGLAGVQAMALQHDEGIEVACNLLAPNKVGPAAVEGEVKKLAEERGLAVKRAYCTGRNVEEMIKLAEEILD
jgi:glutamate formiminotransferase